MTTGGMTFICTYGSTTAQRDRLRLSEINLKLGIRPISSDVRPTIAWPCVISSRDRASAPQHRRLVDAVRRPRQRHRPALQHLSDQQGNHRVDSLGGNGGGPHHGSGLRPGRAIPARWNGFPPSLPAPAWTSLVTLVDSAAAAREAGGTTPVGS